MPLPRRRSRKPLAAVAGTAGAIAVAGTVFVLSGHNGTPGPEAGTLAAKPQSCHQQYAAWKAGPAKAGADKMVADLKTIQAQADAEDFPGTQHALQAAGSDAAALRAYPMPACADPARYWPRILTYIKAAGDNAGSVTGLGGLLVAMQPLSKVAPLETRLGAEIKRTTAAPKSHSTSAPAAGACKLKVTFDYIERTTQPGLQAQADEVGNVNYAACASTLSTFRQEAGEADGECTTIAKASANPGYKVNRTPAPPLRHVIQSAGPGC
jgi:hypothetical protein